jgi:hypothetical protein
VYPDSETIVNTFHAIPAGLTRVGLSQMYYSGAMLRVNYGEQLDLLSPDWRYDVHAAEFEFRARGQFRHQQSASAQGNGLFPVGTGFETYPDRAQPIAIKSFMADQDSALHTPAPECAARAADDNAQWTATVGGTLMQQQTPLIDALSKVCGSDILADPDPAAQVKNVGDALDFLSTEGLPRPASLDAAMAQAVSTLSHEMLLSKLFNTAEKRCYWLGDFPKLLLDGFECKVAAAAGTKTKTACANLRFRSYVVSREMLYVNVAVLGLVHADTSAGGASHEPVTMIPPASSLVFELHRRGSAARGDDDNRDTTNDDDDDDSVATKVDWRGGAIPLTWDNEWHVKFKLQIPRVSASTGVQNTTASSTSLLYSTACVGGCSLMQFRQVYKDLDEQVGKWRQVCKKVPGQEPQAKEELVQEQEHPATPVMAAATVVMTVASLMVGIAAGVWAERRRNIGRGRSTSMLELSTPFVSLRDGVGAGDLASGSMGENKAGGGSSAISSAASAVVAPAERRSYGSF